MAHILRIVGLAIVALIAIELLSREALPKISRLESRLQQEITRASTLKPQDGTAQTVLIVGNSLLNASIDEVYLNRMLRPGWTLDRLVVFSATYNDVYFGLRGLFARGARPRAVVVMLSSNQLISDQVLGPYAAYELFTATDSLAAGMRAGLHRTDVANMFVGHFSAYYAMREHIRKFAMRFVVPDAAALAPLLAGKPIPLPHSARESARRMAVRMRELTELCATYHTTCQFTLAPRPIRASERDALAMALGEQYGLGTQSLQTPGPWPESEFRDDRYHMNLNGRARFTLTFAPTLRDQLARLRSEGESK